MHSVRGIWSDFKQEINWYCFLHIYMYVYLSVVCVRRSTTNCVSVYIRRRRSHRGSSAAISALHTRKDLLFQIFPWAFSIVNGFEFQRFLLPDSALCREAETILLNKSCLLHMQANTHVNLCIVSCPQFAVSSSSTSTYPHRLIIY